VRSLRISRTALSRTSREFISESSNSTIPVSQGMQTSPGRSSWMSSPPHSEHFISGLLLLGDDHRFLPPHLLDADQLVRGASLVSLVSSLGPLLHILGAFFQALSPLEELLLQLGILGLQVERVEKPTDLGELVLHAHSITPYHRSSTLHTNLYGLCQ